MHEKLVFTLRRSSYLPAYSNVNGMRFSLTCTGKYVSENMLLSKSKVCSCWQKNLGYVFTRSDFKVCRHAIDITYHTFVRK